jgi:hypothetical protein
VQASAPKTTELSEAMADFHANRKKKNQSSQQSFHQKLSLSLSLSVAGSLSWCIEKD